jgi:hypothetical protein
MVATRNLAIASDVSIGAGLSSSEALEISVGFALAEMAGLEISRLDLARVAQEAEHVFVGTNSGLMDQFTATFAEKNHAMLIDCDRDRHLDLSYGGRGARQYCAPARGSDCRGGEVWQPDRGGGNAPLLALGRSTTHT